jgi:hypothetical protein
MPPGMGKAGFWTSNRTETVEREWLAGVPASIIARNIGGGCNKNMVIGKADRLNLPRREKKAAMRAWAQQCKPPG